MMAHADITGNMLEIDSKISFVHEFLTVVGLEQNSDEFSPGCFYGAALVLGEIKAELTKIRNRLEEVTPSLSEDALSGNAEGVIKKDSEATQ